MGIGCAGIIAAGAPAAGSGGAGTGARAGTGGAAGALTGTAGASGAPAAAGGGAMAGMGGAGASGGAFETCVASLKAKCSYEDKETACSSLMTPSIPLTAGGAWGNLEIKSGPYGGYVEWNEGMAFANPINPSEDSCAILAGSFAEPQSVTDDVLDLRGGDLSLYTVFRPACMKDGEKYPVITWGNGTCGQSGGYATLLATVASHGFVIFAANSRFTDAGNNEMLKALDFAKAANEDSKSVLYQKLDLEKVGAMGHSQGSSATANAARDPRIKAVILWNGGSSASKPFLAVSGDRDITGYSPSSMAQGVMSASQPGAWLYYHKVLETGGNVTGHLTLMEQAERVTDPTIAWWKYMLQGDAEAKKMFVGPECGLCKKPDEFEFGSHNLP
jgi:pimeloyl-ACP methyl ester carboxylesterase